MAALKKLNISSSNLYLHIKRYNNEGKYILNRYRPGAMQSILFHRSIHKVGQLFLSIINY